MFRLCTILVLLSVAVYTDAALALFPREEKPAEFVGQEGCYLKHLSKVIPYGNYYAENECIKYTCFSTNETQLVTCGVTVVDPKTPCKLISNEREKYPNCCPKIICSTIPPETSKTTEAPESKHRTTDAVSTIDDTDHLVTETSDSDDSPSSEKKTKAFRTERSKTSKTIPVVFSDSANELLIAQASSHNRTH